MLVERKDYEFLLLATKFCSKIDKYFIMLDIPESEIEQLKNDTASITYIFTNQDEYPVFNENFVKNKIQNMRINFSYIAQRCRNSHNYTIPIGMDLGLEIPIYEFQAN